MGSTLAAQHLRLLYNDVKCSEWKVVLLNLVENANRREANIPEVKGFNPKQNAVDHRNAKKKAKDVLFKDLRTKKR